MNKTDANIFTDLIRPTAVLGLSREDWKGVRCILQTNSFHVFFLTVKDLWRGKVALPNVHMYNGTKKLEQDNKMFMDKNSIMECILALQTKNSEGFDRIPQRILVDGADILIVAFEGNYFS